MWQEHYANYCADVIEGHYVDRIKRISKQKPEQSSL
jgi:hypothetical protein